MENYELKNYLESAIEELENFCSKEEALKKIGMPIEDYLNFKDEYEKSEIFKERIEKIRNFYLNELNKIDPKIALYVPVCYSEKELTNETNDIVGKLWKHWNDDWMKLSKKEKLSKFESERCKYCVHKGTEKCNKRPLNAGEPMLVPGDYDFIEISKEDCPNYKE